MTEPVEPAGEPTPSSSPDATAALARCLRETEAHVAGAGWDAPMRLFALVRLADALSEDPALASMLPEPDGDPHQLIAVEQEGLPEAETLEDLLAQISWPESVDGAAIVIERVVVPPSAEAEVNTEDPQAVAALADREDAQDVRMAAGVLRSGERWCALRARSHDTDDQVMGGPELVPGLVAALAVTLED